MTAESQANVLLVDDRPENLLAMESILEGLGQNLVRASSGMEALRFLLVEDVALILLDVQMPGLNGFELAELIRERERTENTPIIFVSATSRDEQYIFKGYSLGAVDYLTKPFEPEILKSKVRFFTKLFQQNQEIKRQAILLEKANSELDELNTELEARVARRTQQLETANQELENEIIVRKHSEVRLATEHAVTKALADANDIESVIPLILKKICKQLNAVISCFWLPNESGSKLTCVHYEVLDKTGNLSPFITASRKTKISPGIGLPGKVWETNAPIWLPNTVRGESFPRAQIAATIGLNCAVGFPIKIGKKFYGVIEFFTRCDLPLDENLVNMLDAIGSEIGQFIQRKRVEADRETLLAREKSLREQAEKASRLKDEFLATVSHELRTPLNAILGWGQMLQTGKVSEDKRQHVLDTIYRNAKSQAQLIDDLLDTSRLITGNLRLDLSPTPIVPIIQAALDTVRPGAEAKGIKLTSIYNAETESIICDPHRFQQMIWNLLTNAVKFTPNEGSVEIKLEQKNNAIEITITDTGQGISAEFLPFVFDRFRQADGSSTRTHDGLGLGLAIVRHLAELHGGSVKAASEGKGKGATFTIALPLSIIENKTWESEQKETNENKLDLVVEIDLKGIGVLIVDDDIDTCEMLNFVLNQKGSETQTANSVEQAFAILTEWKPDVIISDINMPDEDGYSLITKLRSLKTDDKAHIPAIALTAMAGPDDLEQAFMSGFQLHLAKPIDIYQLTDAILNLTKKTTQLIN